MKKILFILVLNFSLTSILLGQISEIHFGVYQKNKFPKPEIINHNQHIYTNLNDYSFILYVPYIGITFKERILMLLEYSKEFYSVGYSFKHPRTQYGGASASVEYGHTITLLGGYYLFNKYSKLNIIPSFGFSIVKSGYFYGAFDIKHNWTQINKDGSLTRAPITSEWKKDYGLHKYYYLLTLNTKITYKPFEFLTVFIQGGYYQGFRTIGYLKGWVQVADEPVIEINNRSRGTHYFLSIGAQINFLLKNTDKHYKL